MKHSFILQATIFFFLALSATSNAQFNGRYATMQNNYQNINPAAINHYYQQYAFAGPIALVNVQGSTQRRATNGSNSAQSFLVEYFDMDRNATFSGGISRDGFYAQETTRFRANMGYQLDLDPRGSSYKNLTLLSFGMGAAYNLRNTDLGQIPIVNPNHNILPVSSTSFYTLSGGAFLLKKRRHQPALYAGLSFFQNIANGELPTSSQFFFVGGLLINSKNHSWGIEPNLTARYAEYDGFIITAIEQDPLTITSGLRIWHYPNSSLNFFGGAYLATSRQHKLECGISLPHRNGKVARRLSTPQRRKLKDRSYPKVRIGYSYTFQPSNILPSPTHDLLVTIPIRLARGNKRGS